MHSVNIPEENISIVGQYDVLLVRYQLILGQK